ncbi:MAG: tripartite tricarboxylate transporter substrate binding protein [Acetobacteraceae bacterium]|nr:tripartite tricarboxylate transporter substrate binding protein [Acetobacteraceae bacterium]
MRRLVLLLALAATALLPGMRSASAQTQLQIVIPWPAGGGTDIIGRLIQPIMSEVAGQQVVIRNVGGAVGTIGTAEVVRARPDGMTLLLTSPNPIALMPSYRPSTPYRADQLATVCMVANAPSVMMTPQATGIRNMADLLARTRATPGGVPVVSTPGGMGHLALSSIERQARTEFNHIPFRGSGDAVLAMQQGTVVLMIAEANLVKQYGLHPIGVLAEERSRDMPDAPTLREQGFDLSFGLWTGIFAPAGTPEPVLARLESICQRTMTAPSVVEGMTRVGHAIEFRGRAAFGEFVRKEVATYARLLQEANIRAAD